MKRLCDFYIRHAGAVGIVYCGVPNLAWFLLTLFLVPFREVYILRLILSLAIGCPIAAYLNRYGVELWLLKHHHPKGPATLLDGILIGASIGMGSALLPTLTILIRSSHLETAKTVIIVVYLSMAFLGAIFGAVIATIARKYVERISERHLPC